jgi:iron(III) transport system substrate-binding protein
MIYKRLLLAFAMACTLGAIPAHSQSGKAPAGAQAELDALIKAARSEGEVVFYSGASANVAQRIADAFTAKYGIKSNYTRTAGEQTIRRFGAEAEAGTFAADFFVSASDVERFAPEAVQKGWLEPIGRAGIPVVRSGEFPAKYLLPNVAIALVSPWGIGYNTQKVTAGNVPKGWLDLLEPRFKGQILIADPRSANAYAEFWEIMLDRYGESFLTRLRDQNLRNYASGIPATNGLAAGEGMVAIPQSAGQMQSVIDKGAPLALFFPSFTTGYEMKVALTHRAKAKHPNAARLFVQYLLSPEGNKVFSADPGTLSVYDNSGLPPEYQSPKKDAVLRLERVAKLLGY